MVYFLLSVVVWASIIGNFLLGFIVLSRNSRDIVNRSFALISLATALWGICLFFFQFPIILPSIAWLKITYVLVVVVVGSLLLFSLVFPKKTKRSYLFPALVYFIPAFIFPFIIIYTDSFVADVIHESWGYLQVLGPAYKFFGIWAV